MILFNLYRRRLKFDYVSNFSKYFFYRKVLAIHFHTLFQKTVDSGLKSDEVLGQKLGIV